MPDATWKGNIKLGAFLTFGVKARAGIKAAGSDGLNMAHADCLGQLRQQYFCESCGETGLGRDASVRTFKGRLVDTDVLASLALDKTDVLELDRLVPADQIDARYFQKSYDLAATNGSGQAYSLLTAMLTRSGRVALGTVNMRGSQYITAIRPRDGILSLEVMYWPEELVTAVRDEALAAVEGVTLSDAEIALGDQLAAMLSKDFEPEQYVNTAAAARRSYLEAIAAGEAPEVASVAAVAKPTASLADALAASIAAMKAA